jgi:uncharacterized protein YjbI with pentapeptide repeats
MRALFSSLRRHAPFLYSERGAISLTRSLGGAGAAGAGTLDAGDNRGISAEDSSAVDLVLTGKTISDCVLSGASLQTVAFEGSTCSRTHLRRATLTNWQGAGSEWDVVDIEGGALDTCSFEQSRWTLTSFRDAALREIQLSGSTLVLCDFTRAELTNADFSGARLSGVDFQDAVFRDVSFVGADLRGCLFTGAWCAGADFRDAAVDGADFRDVGGLDDTARADLSRRGAFVGGGRIRGLWTRVLGGADPATSQPRIRAAMGTTWVVLALLIPALFFGRAILNPVNPDVPPGAEQAQP